MEAAHVDLAEFDGLVEEIKEGGPQRPTIDKQPTDTKLRIYAFGRQGKFGDCNDAKPGMFAIKEKKKWEAWTAIKGMDQEEAKKQFIILVKTVLKK